MHRHKHITECTESNVPQQKSRDEKNEPKRHLFALFLQNATIFKVLCESIVCHSVCFCLERQSIHIHLCIENGILHLFVCVHHKYDCARIKGKCYGRWNRSTNILLVLRARVCACACVNRSRSLHLNLSISL